MVYLVSPSSLPIARFSAGTCSITASQPGNASYTAATPVTRSFTVSAASPSISFAAAAASPFAVGTYPNSAVVGDFNGDGIRDVATADTNSSTVTVLLGNGSGGFTAATGSPFAAGSLPYSLTLGDFNGDGIPDIATASFFGTVTVLLGNGSGGFTQVAGSPFAAGTNPYALVAGDFNGDGVQDLAVTNTNGITVLLGNGLGGFSTAPGSPFAVGTTPQSVVVGDFNADGIQDLAVANESSNNVSVLLGNGLGGFTAATGSPFAVGPQPASVVVGDFNGDGIQDLATANYGGNTVTVLLGTGSGGFAGATGSPFAVGTNPNSVVVGDFNGDGIQDLATANYGGNTATVLLGNGSGGFTPAASNSFALGTNPRAIGVGDFNGDGIEDLVTANNGSNNITVLLGVAPGTTPQTITFGSLGAVTFGASPFTIGATATSSLTVSFTGTTASVCTVSGTTVTIAGGGTCSITASQTGNATYAPATPVVRSFTVNPASQTITFGSLGNVTNGVAPFGIGATAISSGSCAT